MTKTDLHAFTDRTAATRVGAYLDRFDDVLEQRAATYRQMAAILVAETLPTATNPTTLLAELLQSAYRAGARDMHTAIAEQLEPLWILAGLED